LITLCTLTPRFSYLKSLWINSIFFDKKDLAKLPEDLLRMHVNWAAQSWRGVLVDVRIEELFQFSSMEELRLLRWCKVGSLKALADCLESIFKDQILQVLSASF
jgi:hypothetical protein